MDFLNVFSKTQTPLDVKPTLESQYAQAGMSSGSVLKGIENNRRMEAAQAAASKLKLEIEDNQSSIRKAVDAGQADGKDTINKYKDLRGTPDLGYVTAAQAKLYMGGILVDECYDVQYQYKEYKEPVYGYNDKHWGAVLKGNVIISGSFTINYKHDSYLVKILEKLKNDGGPNARLNAAWKRKQDADAAAKQFKIKLNEYKQNVDRQNKINEDITSYDAQIESLTIQLEEYGKMDGVINADFDSKLKAAEKEKLDFMNGLSAQDQQTVLNEETAFTTAASSYKNITESNKEILQEADNIVEQLNQQISTATNLLKKYEAEVIDLKAMTAKDKVDRSKEIALVEERISMALADISKYNQQKTSKLEAIADIKKSLTESLENGADAVKDTLSSDSRQYVQMKLKETKLKALQQEALQNLGGQKQLIEDQLAALKALKKSSEETVDQLVSGLDSIDKEVRALKAKLNEINDDLLQAAFKPDGETVKEAADRAEDAGTWGHLSGLKFSLFIEYNGIIHKILEECTLTGHGHVVAQGGEVIKEYYTFISKKIR